MRWCRILPAALSVSIILTVTTCTGSSDAGQELKGRGDRRPPNREFLNGAVAADINFGIDLYHGVAPGSGNFAYSPYAVLTALSMVRAGSAGTTRAQLDAALYASATPDLDAGLRTIDDLLGRRVGEKRSDTRRGKLNLEVAAALWGQRGNHVKDDYLNLLTTSYGTGFRVTDFRSDSEASRQAVNQWGSDATHGHISELVPRGVVTPYTRFLTTTAMYLQAPWQLPFQGDKTRPETFHRNNGTSVDVRMMQLTAPSTTAPSATSGTSTTGTTGTTGTTPPKDQPILEGLRTASGPTWEAVELPYLGDELVLDLVMPAPGQFDAFEQALTPDGLAGITDSLQPGPLDLHLPQFQFTTQASLRDVLSAHGLDKAFSREADFSGVTTDEALSLSEVVYQGFFGVNEEGTDAQNTATLVPKTEVSMRGARRLVIDRPFLFFVRDRETGLLLLVGRVVDPR
jgi:serpin B